MGKCPSRCALSLEYVACISEFNRSYIPGEKVFGYHSSLLDLRSILVQSECFLFSWRLFVMYDDLLLMHSPLH